MKEQAKVPEKEPRDVVTSRGANRTEPANSEEVLVQSLLHKHTLSTEEVKGLLAPDGTNQATTSPPDGPDFKASLAAVRGQLAVALQTRADDDAALEDDAWAIWAAAHKENAL